VTKFHSPAGNLHKAQRKTMHRAHDHRGQGSLWNVQMHAKHPHPSAQNNDRSSRWLCASTQTLEEEGPGRGGHRGGSSQDEPVSDMSITASEQLKITCFFTLRELSEVERIPDNAALQGLTYVCTNKERCNSVPNVCKHTSGGRGLSSR
jgi:hypothetical protein